MWFSILPYKVLDVPDLAIESMLEAIQEMETYIRTAFGISDKCYGNDPFEAPPIRVMQGNGAGPAGWTSVFRPMVECMKAAGFGYEHWSVIKRCAITLVCFTFVDDATLVHSNNDPRIPTEIVLQEAQEALNTWEGLLLATGGHLAPEKSYWYLLEIIRDRGKWRFASKTSHPGELYLNNGTFTNKQLEPSQPQEALGIMCSLDGSMKAELKYLRGKVDKWCDAVRTKKILAGGAWYCLTSTIMKTIEYPLPATSSTQAQLDSLMCPILKVALNKCCVQNNLPRKLVYGTLKSRGLALKYPWWLQLIFHLQQILSHCHRLTPSWDLLNDNIELVQYYVGSQVPFWELPFQDYGHLAPEGWVKCTWKAMDDTPLTIKGPDIVEKLLRPHDVFLADAFVEFEYSTEDQLTLQDCRMHLGVTSLAQISTACGSRITVEAWKGQKLTTVHKTTGIQTYKPVAKHWNLWRSALTEAFLHPNLDRLPLRQQLGVWHTGPDQQWIWWKHQTSNTLYEHRQSGEWFCWSFARVWHHQRKYNNPTPAATDTVPENMHQGNNLHFLLMSQCSPLRCLQLL